MKIYNLKESSNSKLIEYHDINIIDSIKKIMDENYVIPNFQRNYVWKKEKIVSFLNSLLRGEPFGNIIIWNSDSITCDTRNSIIKKLSKTIDIDKKNKSYIIDGQQRLTTLFSLHNWNLINKHENIIEIKKISKIFSSIFLNLETYQLEILTTDNIDKKFIKLIDIIKPFNEKNVTVYQLIKNFNKNNNIYNTNELDLISEIIDDINKKLCTTKIGIIELDRFSLDEVIEIFNNINTKGEKLSIFEIINAKWYSININLEKEFNKLDEKICHLGFENIDFQIMLDGLYLNINNKKISTIEKIEYKLLNNNDYYNELLTNYLKSFHKMCIYLSRLNFNKKNLPSKIILKWLSYFYMINNYKDPDGEQNKFLKKYIFLLSINNVYRSSTNSQLLKDIEFVGLLRNKNYKEIQKIFDSFEKKEFTIEMINNTYYGDSSMISNIVKYTLFNISKDIFKNTNISTKSDISNIDLHHIFPKKAKCNITNEIYEKKYDEIDNYANLMPIDNDTNKKISHKRPSEYYNEFFSQNTNIDNCLEESLINIDYFKNNEFYNFLNERKQKIVNKINEIFLGK